MLDGVNEEQINHNRSAAMLSHFPAGTSGRNMVHYGQMYKAKKFQRYDYEKNNDKKYGRPTPPEFDLGTISNKFVCLMHSDNDYLSSPEDVERLKSKLQPGVVVDDYRVPIASWNHLDFIIGNDAGLYINQRVVKLLQQYN